MQHSAFPVCLCRLTLAWISSETSTKLLGMPTYPDWSSSLLWSLSHANSSLCCPVSTALSVVRRQLPSSSPFVQLPSRVPIPTSGHTKTSSPKPFVWFRAKTDKGIVCISKSSSITGASLLDCLVSYPEDSLGEIYLSAESQSVYRIAIADWARSGRSCVTYLLETLTLDEKNLWPNCKRISGYSFCSKEIL